MQTYQAAVDDFDRELARLLGVNETDLRCLEILLDVEETAPRELSAQLGLSTGSVTAMLDRLEKLGYLTRSPHPTDRRKTVVRATADFTEHAYGLMAPFLHDVTERLLPRYTPEQLTVIADFFARNRDIQQEHTERLRQIPASHPPRTGGRQAPGPRNRATGPK
ncbi:MarR family transcriptional regulator [Actinoallomurus purpureus]|uniref:MarR family winged helix-turn-helix transcriptional regulator n=1 Tax=Actinoallomurus purpureus TaxID=478114 RepID=UPI0020929205|nr:MarR family transcriptional regulator [Actinoallomurus purpureus]MCO6005379.1 MarR family transcriptional regulator [Actinoallomurus purpureus]